MMALPFLLLFLALLLAWRGQRGPSLGLWGLALVVLLVLFKEHATSTIGIIL